MGLGTERIEPGLLCAERDERDLLRRLWFPALPERAHEDGTRLFCGRRLWRIVDHPGVFYTVAATKSVSTVEATKAMLEEIDDLKTKPFTHDELRRAKDELLNSFVFRYDSRKRC